MAPTLYLLKTQLLRYHLFMQRLIIDTDPGVDDAQAILMASAHPDSKIEAITVVGGNVGLEHTVRNALTLVELIEQDIPVYAGCGLPLIGFQEDAAFVHGKDGLGDAGMRPTVRQVEQEHATNALIRMVSAEPNEFTLVAIGPLTNVALAIKLDPSLPNKIKRFVVMGGAVTGKGNTSNFSAEFNIYHDPEAAFIVFEAWGKAGKQIEVVDWELTTRNGFSAELLNRWATIDSARARFFTAINAQSRQVVLELFGRDMQFGADPLALAVVLEPTIVKHAETHHLIVETMGARTRGQTVVDWGDRSGEPRNATIILDLDTDRFHALMEAGLQRIG